MSEMEIRFSVSGYVKQRVELLADNISEEELQSGLNSGKYATTIQEGGHIINVATDEKIAVVVDVDNNCEYEDFEVEEG